MIQDKGNVVDGAISRRCLDPREKRLKFIAEMMDKFVDVE